MERRKFLVSFLAAGLVATGSNIAHALPAQPLGEAKLGDENIQKAWWRRWGGAGAGVGAAGDKRRT